MMVFAVDRFERARLQIEPSPRSSDTDTTNAPATPLGGGGVDTFTVGSSGFGDRYPNLFGTRVTTRPPKIPYQTGQASWYGGNGDRFAGRPTASGAIFDPNKLTCAHPSLAFGTKLRVVYKGKSAEVTVTDRGPFSGGRIIDLSRAAAKALGLLSAGVGRVDIYKA
jgi:rare lipoprotein A